jgi:MYXO-CTERM domain-containing protein
MRLLPPLCCLAAVLAVPAVVRADVITPDTILRPPPATVGSANGTPVTSAADLVRNQYAGVGLVFPPQPGTIPGISPTVVVTSLGGVSAWAPAMTTEAVAGRVALVDYHNAITAQLTHPAAGLSVEVVGAAGETLIAFDSHGHQLGFGQASATPGPHGGSLLTVVGQDVSSFTVVGPLVPGSNVANLPQPQPWGVAQVETSAAHAPEPASCLLAGLGLLGLGAFAVGRRRKSSGLGKR